MNDCTNSFLSIYECAMKLFWCAKTDLPSFKTYVDGMNLKKRDDAKQLCWLLAMFSIDTDMFMILKITDMLPNVRCVTRFSSFVHAHILSENDSDDFHTILCDEIINNSMKSDYNVTFPYDWLAAFRNNTKFLEIYFVKNKETLVNNDTALIYAIIGNSFEAAKIVIERRLKISDTERELINMTKNNSSKWNQIHQLSFDK